MKTILQIAILLLLACSSRGEEKKIVRVGHFPNITHVQALVARQMSRQGKGWFEQRLGSNVEVQWFSYNAGPSAMEAIFANSLDLTYAGPSPVLNAYSKARGNEMRIISNAANGGAALVIQPDSSLTKPADFKGKKIATPQMGNTQDIACRAWLSSGGLKITQLGGDAFVLPAQNPDQLALFKQKQVDGVWTVEPWVSRLEMEAGGKVLFEETDAITTVLVSSVRFLKNHPDLVRQFAAAHRELTDWIKANPAEAQSMVRAELTELMGKDFPSELVEKSWKRIILTNEIQRAELEKFVASAQAAGFLKKAPDLGNLIVTP
jgi:NitT/TauT family transport system substrate-binding protein